ncbi:MAG: oligoendopeptidase F [Spirochaetaceae bacterium]|jgi:oligoendopeptidase F|nr:oligoendopeptidase F [Spirochaetaceae bacterium]
MSKTGIPARSEIAQSDRWNLAKLFSTDHEWEAGLAEFEKLCERISSFKGNLGKSASALADFMDFSREFGILEERLAYYAELRQCEDEGANEARIMTGKFTIIAAKAAAGLSWAIPEIQAIANPKIEEFLRHERLADYRIYIKRLLRWKPYILSEAEERLLAIENEADGLVNDTFSVLTNVDLDFGTIETAQGPRTLSQSSWSVFMENPDRNLRKNAYDAFYRAFESHKTTLAVLYGSSVKKDAIKARVRGFSSAREAALFPDNVPLSVYDNLIETINANLAPLHHYYNLRKRALKLDVLRHYDVYAPIVPYTSKKTNWNEAVDVISASLAPLGNEYVDILRGGLLGGWADKYENKGKRSGAFSAGSYTTDPYILMNYKEDSIRDIFTLTHEGGHSMHSYFSAKSNPFMHYGYTIFEAEVASTFNEELLFRHLEKESASPELNLYIVNKRADDILSTLYRQTMFAEFEKITHQIEESGEALTVDNLRGEYRKLLEKYFGPDMVLEESSDMEGLRIPHFYRAFYVYKYATGISASLALAQRVLDGGEKERNDYFAFLKSGGSRFPIDSLKVAGVDMSSPIPVQAACDIFGKLVDKLESLLQV